MWGKQCEAKKRIHSKVARKNRFTPLLLQPLPLTFSYPPGSGGILLLYFDTINISLNKKLVKFRVGFAYRRVLFQLGSNGHTHFANMYAKNKIVLWLQIILLLCIQNECFVWFVIIFFHESIIFFFFEFFFNLFWIFCFLTNFITVGPREVAPIDLIKNSILNNTIFWLWLCLWSPIKICN